MDGNLIASMQSIFREITLIQGVVIYSFVYLIGTIIFLTSLLYLLKTNQGMMQQGITSQETKGAIVGLIIGALLFNLPSFIDSASLTLGMRGSDARNMLLGGTGFDGSDVSSAAASVAKAFFFLSGLIAFIKGLLIINAWGKGQNVSFTSGLWFIIGGTLAMNVNEVVNAVASMINLPAFTSLINGFLN